MKRIFLIGLLVIASIFAQAQDPFSWNFSAVKTGKGVYELHLSLVLEPGWHIYSQTTPEGGPDPASISFDKNLLVTFEGVIKEVGKLQQKFEPIFGIEVKQYSNSVDFVQVVRKKSSAKTTVNGKVEFMLCDDRQCLPPTKENFSISIK